MANLPKCTECEYNNLMEVTCRLYPTGIPDDIFVEIKKCDYYKKRKEKYTKFIINRKLDTKTSLQKFK